MTNRPLFSFLLIVIFAFLVVSPARASFHLMQIEQVIGGVDGDLTAQAIQLRMRAAGQNFVGSARIRVWDASGSNPVVVINFPTLVANGTTGARVLVTSAQFNSSTSPTAVPDFAMTSLIPSSYLAAGSMTFENNTGTQVWWRLSWGGGAYTGPTTGIGGPGANDSDGNFGVFPTALPSSSTQSLLFLGSATSPSTTNAVDYNITSGDAVFTNNAGASFTVQSTATGIGPIAVAGDLLQNWPNPFNPTTRILFNLARDGYATLRVYDVAGHEVATLVNRSLTAGPHNVVWDARDARGQDVVSGVYFYRLTAPGVERTRRMVLLK